MGVHPALCARSAKSRLFSTPGSHGSQGPSDLGSDFVPFVGDRQECRGYVAIRPPFGPLEMAGVSHQIVVKSLEQGGRTG